MDQIETQRLTRCGFNEIVAGFTPLKFKGRDLYIKHFGAKDQIEVDSVYNDYIEKLKRRGVPTSKERAEQLEKDELWTAKDEAEMVAKSKEIEELRRAKKLLFLKSQIDEQQAKIDKLDQEYLGMLIKKNELFGKTAELFANKRVSDFCIVNSIFLDTNFEKPYFDKSSMLELDDETMEEITNQYNEVVKKFDEVGLKRIGLSNLFQNYYFLAKSVYELYGKAIVNLTFYQIQLATFGDYYKNILFSQNPPPPEVATDPEKLDEWITGAANAQKIVENNLSKDESEGEGMTFTSLVGATKSDLEYLGMNKQQNTVSLNDKLKEAGGHLTKADLMKLMGVS